MAIEGVAVGAMVGFCCVEVMGASVANEGERLGSDPSKVVGYKVIVFGTSVGYTVFSGMGDGAVGLIDDASGTPGSADGAEIPLPAGVHNKDDLLLAGGCTAATFSVVEVMLLKYWSFSGKHGCGRMV